MMEIGRGQTRFYEVFDVAMHGKAVETQFSARDPRRHKSLRWPLAAKFSAWSVRSFESSVDESIEAFTRLIRDSNGQPVNLVQWLEFWAFDTASAIAFGEPFGFIKGRCDVRGILSGLKGGFRYGAIVGQVPCLHQWLIGNQNVVRFLRKYAKFQDPTADVLQVFFAL